MSGGAETAQADAPERARNREVYPGSEATSRIFSVGEHVSTAEHQRRELAEFLRSRRERVDPSTAGLRPYGRRRTPGLRREEVATLAGMSVTWYTWLEQGRRIRASRQILGSLARALRLDDAETEYLFSLAGEMPPTAGTGRYGEDVSRQYRILLDQLDPQPAFITNGRFDVLAWNIGFTILFPGFTELPTLDRNTLAMTFSPALRSLYPDWETEASRVVALFRKHAGEQLVQPEFIEIVDRLSSEDADFRRLWQRRDLVSLAPASRVFDHPELGMIELGYVKMYTADDNKNVVVHQALPGSELANRFAELVERERVLSGIAPAGAL